MLVRFVALTLLVVGFAAACSSDSGSSGTDTGAMNGGGQGGQAGGASTGGTTATGGAAMGTGGYDPALAAQCAIDSSGSDCVVCLAANCCDAVKGCFAEKACKAAFDKYQTCVKDPAQVDPTECFSTFTRAQVGDASAAQMDFAKCVIGPCQACGGAGLL